MLQKILPPIYVFILDPPPLEKCSKPATGTTLIVKTDLGPPLSTDIYNILFVQNTFGDF